MEPIVQEFSEYVKKLFDGKTRRDGVTPYFTHLDNVRKNTVMLQGDWSHLQMIALAHDTLEDTDVTETELTKVIFDLTMKHYPEKGSLKAIMAAQFIVRAVVVLTKKEGESYDEYLLKIKNLERDILLIKIADLLDNLSDGPSEKQRLKYRRALEILRGDA